MTSKFGDESVDDLDSALTRIDERDRSNAQGHALVVAAWERFRQCGHNQFRLRSKPFKPGDTDVSPAWEGAIGQQADRYASALIDEVVEACEAFANLPDEMQQQVVSIAEQRRDSDERVRIISQEGFRRLRGLLASTDREASARAWKAVLTQQIGKHASYLRGFHAPFDRIAAALEPALRGREIVATKKSPAPREGRREQTVAPDFSWLKSGAVRYEFQTPTQRFVIKALWETREKGGDGAPLTIAKLAEDADSGASVFRMDQVFRKHPAFRTIVRSRGSGLWALVLDEPIPDSSHEGHENPG